MDATGLLTILLMAVVTFLTRVLGYVGLRNRALGPRATAMMQAAPGCVLIAVIAPFFATRQPADLLALAIAVLAATGLPMPATVIVAIVAAGALRHLIG